jgi:glycosyltransferase involved in cell wall biosynthesis
LNVLLTDATDIFGGGEEYVLILARHLRMRGHNVLVSANPNHLLLQKCESAGIATVPLRYGDMAKVFSVGAQLRAAIRRHGIDIIHSNANYDRTCAAIGAMFTDAKHVATVHSAHSIQYNLTHWLRNNYGIAHFIAVAEVVNDVLVNDDRIDRSRIAFIPNGVESMSATAMQEARRKARDAWGVGQNTLVIGNVARLVPFKGHAHLLHSIARIVKVSPDAFFPILGDGELMSELKRQADSLNIEKHVRFFGFQDNASTLYPAFDIYCHSSIERAEEAFPLAILQALAVGLPVVSTNVGSINLMVENGISGYLTPPENPKRFADALLKIIADRDLRRSMGKASFDLFNRQYHASVMAERVEQVYNSVLTQTRSV